MRLIDADALKEKIEIDNFDSPMMNPVMTMTKVLEYIDEQPTLEPDRPHGEWTINGEDIDYICSVCGDVLPYSDEYDYKTDFCPNCGADMRVKTDLN